MHEFSYSSSIHLFYPPIVLEQTIGTPCCFVEVLTCDEAALECLF